MITIKLQGGLGNQLFQYAHGRSLELAGKKIVFDTSFYYGNKAKIDTARDFKLMYFNLETKAKFSKKTHPFIDLSNKIMTRIGMRNGDFWQSEKYFCEIKDNIRREFTIKNQLSQNAQIILSIIQKSANSVSLHVRRGDYINDAKTKRYHGICDENYYVKALEYVMLKTGKGIRIFIFSDDINWVRDNMHLSYPIIYVSSPRIMDHEEMILMSLCEHHIIANSSFSWWGAWLGQNRDKIVVAPTQWTSSKTSTELDVLPAGWITF